MVGLRKITKYLNQNSQYGAQVLTTGSPVYPAGLRDTRPQTWIHCCCCCCCCCCCYCVDVVVVVVVVFFIFDVELIVWRELCGKFVFMYRHREGIVAFNRSRPADLTRNWCIGGS